MVSTVKRARAWRGRLSGLVLGVAAPCPLLRRFPNPLSSMPLYPVRIARTSGSDHQEHRPMSQTVTVTHLLTRKKALDENRIATYEMDLVAQPGEIIMMPDHFALTTNNITYAAFGDSMRYWDFYPTGEADWGHMPVWGFANVVASGVEGIEVGARYYGYYPIASHVRIKAGTTPRGFRALDEHRAELPTPYNQYPLCEADPYYSPRHEDLQALLKPLYLTSAMLADFLIDNQFFGARRLVFSSASSKTAYCTLFCLEGHDVETIGLTSPSNIPFVEQLGCYTRAL